MNIEKVNFNGFLQINGAENVLDVFDADVMNIIFKKLMIPNLLCFGSTCHEARSLIFKQISDITKLSFSEDNTIIYKDLPIILDWDRKIMEEGFKQHYGLFVKNLKLLENCGCVNSDKISTSIFITLLFYETIVNRKSGLIPSVIRQRLNCRPDKSFSDSEINNAMTQLSQHNFIIYSKNNKSEGNLSLRYGVEHEYKKVKKTDEFHLYRIKSKVISEQKKVKIAKQPRVLSEQAEKIQKLNPHERIAYKSGQTRGEMDAPLKKCRLKLRDESYQQLYLEGYSDASKNTEEELKLKRRNSFIDYQKDYGLKKRKKETVSSEDSSYISQLIEESSYEEKFTTNDLKMVRFSNSLRKEVTDCFIPLFNKADINDDGFAIKFICAYQLGHQYARDFIREVKEAIRLDDDGKLNQLMRDFNVGALRKILPEEVFEIKVNTFRFDGEKGLIPSLQLRDHQNPRFQFTLVEKEGI